MNSTQEQRISLYPLGARLEKARTEILQEANYMQK